MLDVSSTLHRLLYNNSELKPSEASNTNECNKSFFHQHTATYTIKATTTQTTTILHGGAYSK